MTAASRIPYPDMAALSREKRDVMNGLGRAPLNITRMALHAPDALWRAHFAFKLACVLGTSMDAKLREVLILRVAHLSACAYELNHHISISANLGFTPALQDAIAAQSYDSLTPEMGAVAEFTDEVVTNIRASDATLEKVRALFGDALVMEMLILIGSYMATARMAQTAGLEPDAEPITSWSKPLNWKAAIMCEEHPKAPKGWIGWIDLPKRAAGKPAGPWIDLTHKVGPDMACASIFPKPSFNKLRSLPADPFNVTEIHMVAHAGTHVDSPLHYFMGAPDMASIPPDRLCGPGVVWNIPKAPNEIIRADDLEKCRPLLEPGDILAVDTGWAARFGTPEYDHHPSFDGEAASWLLEKKIKLLACDFATPDLVYHLRQPGFDWPVHHILLANGILVCEHLTNHAQLAGSRAEFFFGAMPLVDGDGAPARVAARLLES